MDSDPPLPISISYISNRYLLFSIDAVTYLRREHHICGVLIGTLPQIPQQNVFLGLPLELMPEEARLLVDKGVACIVDEAKAHDGMRSLLEEDRARYLRDLESQGQHAIRLQSDRKEQKREEALKKLDEKKAAKARSSPSASAQTESSAAIVDIFNSERRNSSTSRDTPTSTASSRMGITPATSYPPLPPPSSTLHLPPPSVPASYPLFAHLHARGYFLSPGLRFGCNYMAYPGDSLRFHAHFLVVSYEWDEEIDLMDIVAGGRLGTGVKKGFLLGGAEKSRQEAESEADRVDSVRAFSIEWAGM
jgi:tRNA-splicing endonuclease subunit Sen34